MIKINETMYSNGQKGNLVIHIEMNAIDSLKFIFNKFGEEAQEHKLIEELSELASSVYHKKKEELPGEMADVLIMISQFLLCDPELSEKVIEQIKFKIDRTMKRIDEKYYETK